MIFETIVTTLYADGRVHIAPMGVREEDGFIIISPFRPSTSLDNLLREQSGVINYTDDVRVFAGCLTGRWQWPTLPVESIRGARLAGALAHTEVRLDRVEDDPVRPRLICKPSHHAHHGPFRGYNRAQAAVLEAAILASRLEMLTREKIDQELAYLKIAIDKTAGPRELEAWTWLMEKIEAHRRQAITGIAK
ncbi:MAG: DUF447 domain-containing protein [Burkholderiales bacterium]